MFNEKDNSIWLSIMDGKIIRTLRDGENLPGEYERTNKVGKVKREVAYPSITATITDILVETTKWGKMWAIYLRGEENGEVMDAKLSIMYNSKAATSFLCCIEGADVTKPVTLSPRESKEIKDGKEVKSTTLFINQGGKAMKWNHTKAEPNGMPAPKQTTVNGQVVWDNTDKLAFFEKIIATVILPKIKGGSVVTEPAVESTPVSKEEKEDLPF